LIAGGEPSRTKFNESYRNYVRKMKNRAAEVSKRIIFTGFIPETKFPVIFSASDLAIFPHKIKIGFSGPMSIAVAYGLPFIASNSFEGVLDEMLIFKNEKELAMKVERYFENQDLNKGITRYINDLKKERSWDNIAKKTEELFKNLLSLKGVD
jgi:glycosyltransferase involved in cell wall biosynthesis